MNIKQLKQYNLFYAAHISLLYCDISSQEFLEITAGPALDPTALGIYLKSQKIDPSGRRLKPDWSDVGYCGAEHFWENTLAWMEHLDNESQLN